MSIRRRRHAKFQLIEAADLIPDGRLGRSEADLLEHDAIARGVAEIALAARTPVNIALFGAWGSGKSSIYSMITNHLNRIAPDEVRIARYDAWKYGGQDLKRNFVHSVAHELGLGNDRKFDEDLADEVSTARLDIPGWLKGNWISLVLGLGIAVGIALIWSSILLAVAVWVGKSPLTDAFKTLIPPTAIVFGAALVAVVVGPQALLGAVVSKKRPAPSGADQFAQRFGELVSKARTARVERMVVFIDELDRCSPEDVVSTLIDLKTFLDQEHCVFIVAADRDVIEQSLRKTPQAKPVREDEPYFATSGAFLDKIFQHQIALPPLRARALTRFAQDLVENQGGLWRRLREHGQETFDRAVFALVPVHVRSPRRVKILLNNFATTCRIAEARGIASMDRASELAVLTVLQTEFPAVAEELRRVPRLLEYLRGDGESKAPEVRDLVSRFGLRVDDDEADTPGANSSETPAGELLSDDEADSGGHKRRTADLTLRRHLAGYLAKVRAAGILDPRPDLLYLQSADNGLALNDPRLGDVIDFAADTAPDDVVRAFAGQDSQTLAVGAALLVIEGDNNHGPGRAFAYESACRLIEEIDRVNEDARQTVVRATVPSLTAATTGRELSRRSMPGALLAACWAGKNDHVEVTLDWLLIAGLPADVRTKLVALFTYLEESGKRSIAELLVRDFGSQPEPLVSALVALPVAESVALWELVRPSVFEFVKRENSSPAVSTGVAIAGSGLTETPLDDGRGTALLSELVAAVRGRQDHEEILSAILASAQTEDSELGAGAWLLDQADALIATMASPVFRTRHALLGMLHYPVESWPTWETYLVAEDLGITGVMLSPLATDVLIQRLIPAIAIADDDTCAGLPAVARSLARLADIDDLVLSEAISAVTTPIQWVAPRDSDPVSATVWARKTAVAEAALALGAESGGTALETLVSDLIAPVVNLLIDEQLIESWLPIVRRLPESAAESLSGQLEEYLFDDDDPATVVRMKLGVRRCFGGEALPAAVLAGLPDGAVDSTMTDDWLALTPPSADVRALVGDVPFKPQNLGAYAARRSVTERTDLWSAAWESNGSASLLDALGGSGIGAGAVEVVRVAVASISRADDRSAAVGRLLAATCPTEDAANRDVRRAVSELALYLLDKGTAADRRTAAQLVIWAGGAGDRSAAKLRIGFNNAHADTKRWPKELSARLTELGLLDAQKKNLLEKFVGR
ncbi:KAP family P-loop NTPase fold protein [Nocardia sp. NPDC003183]